MAPPNGSAGATRSPSGTAAPAAPAAPGVAAPGVARTIRSLRELRDEVDNALTPALGHVQRLERHLPDWAGEEDRESLRAIHESLARAARLLDAAGLRQPERCELVALLAAALTQMPPERFRDTQVRLMANVPLVGWWVEREVVRVLVNLLGNAATYSPPGTPIEVTLGARDGLARVAVRVHGSGIADADLDRKGSGIADADLDRNFRGCRTKRARDDAEGSGMGLRISRRLAEAAGGRLWAETARSATSFVLELPLGRLASAHN